jgi:uncharacterized protein YdeI (YjbR/CyaY-like superfamily)
VDTRPTKAKSPEAWLATVPEGTRALCAEARDAIAEWAPDLIQSIKWNMLAFSGSATVVLLGGFTRHVSVFFHRGAELSDPGGLMAEGTGAQMRMVQLRSVDDLARPGLRSLVRAAAALDTQGKPPRAPRPPRPPPEIPPVLAAALRKNRAAAAGFARLPPSCQREYIVWITTAKRPETREHRLATTLSALASGRKWAQRNNS